jgi:hypothetical protein
MGRPPLAYLVTKAAIANAIRAESGSKVHRRSRPRAGRAVVSGRWNFMLTDNAKRPHRLFLKLANGTFPPPCATTAPTVSMAYPNEHLPSLEMFASADQSMAISQVGPGVETRGL